MRLLKKATLKPSIISVLLWLSVIAAFIVGYVFYLNVKPNKQYGFSMIATVDAILNPGSTIFLLWWVFIAIIALIVSLAAFGHSVEFNRAKKRLARLISIHEPIYKALKTTSGKNIISPTPLDINIKKPKAVMKALDLVENDLNVTWWDGGDSIRDKQMKEVFADSKKNKTSPESFDYFGINEFKKDAVSKGSSFSDENILNISVRIGRKYNATLFDLMAVVNSVEKYENNLEKEKAAIFNKKNKKLIHKGLLKEASAKPVYFTSNIISIFGSQIRVNRALRTSEARVFNEKIKILGVLNNEAFTYTGHEEEDDPSYIPDIVFSDEFTHGSQKKFTKVIISHSDQDFSDKMPIDISVLKNFFNTEYPLPGNLEWFVSKTGKVITIDLTEKKAVSLEEEKAKTLAENIIVAVQKVSPISREVLSVEVTELDFRQQLKTMIVLFDEDYKLTDIEKKQFTVFVSNIIKILKNKIPGDWDFQYTDANSELIVKNFS